MNYNINSQNITKHNSRRIRLVIVVSILLPITFIVYSAISSSHGSLTLQSMEDELAELKKQNKSIQSDIIKNTSLSDFRVRSESLGFTEAEHTIYLDRKSPVASLR